MWWLGRSSEYPCDTSRAADDAGYATRGRANRELGHATALDDRVQVISLATAGCQTGSTCSIALVDTAAGDSTGLFADSNVSSNEWLQGGDGNTYTLVGDFTCPVAHFFARAGWDGRDVSDQREESEHGEG